MEIRHILKQLVCLTLTASSVVTADCPEIVRANLLDPCIKDRGLLSARYDVVTRLRLKDLWQLDTGGVHPPLRLPQLEIERLVMESLWGLRPGESMIGDPRWGNDKRQPDLDAIASLRAREAAMARMAEKN